MSCSAMAYFEDVYTVSVPFCEYRLSVLFSLYMISCMNTAFSKYLQAGVAEYALWGLEIGLLVQLHLDDNNLLVSFDIESLKTLSVQRQFMSNNLSKIKLKMLAPQRFTRFTDLTWAIT